MNLWKRYWVWREHQAANGEPPAFWEWHGTTQVYLMILLESWCLGVNGESYEGERWLTFHLGPLQLAVGR